MATISIDGPAKIIDVSYDDITTVVAATDIYSRWKDWVKLGNAGFLPAFENSVGGNELGGGVSIDGYYFIRNDYGWRIRAADANHTLVIEGQLFGFDITLPVYLPRAGRTIIYKELQSSRASVVDSGGGSTLTAQQIRNAMTLAATIAASDESVDDKLKKIKNDTSLIPATL